MTCWSSAVTCAAVACCWPRSAVSCAAEFATAWFAAATWGSRAAIILLHSRDLVAPGQDRGEAAGAMGEQELQLRPRPLQGSAQRGRVRLRGVERGLGSRDLGAQRRVGRFRRVALLPQLAEDLAGLELPVARDAQIVLGGGDRVQRSERPQRRDVAVEGESGVALVQSAFQAVAEQRAERLAGADAVEQGEREPHAPRREVEGERLAGPAGVRQVPGAQDRGGGRLTERRSMDVAVARRLCGRRGAHVLEHAVTAEPQAERAPGAQRSEPARWLAR